MSLVILAETNILGHLNKHKIYPDFFFTDFDMFDDFVSVNPDLDILVIVTGGCEFQRRKLFSVFKDLRGSMNDEFTTIKSIEILSDLQLPQVEDYYRYINGDLFNYQHYAGWKPLHYNGGFNLKDYRSEPKPCEIFLSKTDRGDASKYLDQIKTKAMTKDEQFGELLRKKLLSDKDAEKLKSVKKVEEITQSSAELH